MSETQPLTETEFDGLKIGDCLLYRGGRDKFEVRAYVTVIRRPSIGCLVRINRLLSLGNSRDYQDFSPGTEIVAGRSELLHMPLPLNEQAIEFALKYLAERREQNRQILKINNAALPAGEVMTFYCISCGGVADVKPELYIFPVREL